MDTEALRTFLAIHQAGGFSLGAERLNRSQPAISRRIALLEAELGAPVFERGHAGISLSQAGKVLLPHAERVLASLEDAQSAVRALNTADAGPVALACVGTLAGPVLTAALRSFTAAHPRVELTLRTATSAQVSELVRRGEATLGLRYHDDASSDLVCHPMAPETLVVVCAPEHPLAGRAVARLADLKGERWLAFPRPADGGEAWAETLFALFLTRGVADIRWTAIDSLTAQKRLAEAGFGLGLMPENAVAEERAAGRLAVIGVGDLAASNPVRAVVRKGGYLSGAAKALLDMLAA